MFSYKDAISCNTPFQALITQSLDSTNNVISVSTVSGATGSIVISGSGNYVSLSQLVGNTSFDQGRTQGFNGTNAYVTVMPIITGSNPNFNTPTDRNNRRVPTITNSNINAAITFTDNRASQATTALTISNSSINSTITSTVDSGSLTISNSNIAGTGLTVSSSNVLGGTGPRTISWTSPNAGITIDSSTITSQNYITLNVSSNVPFSTYSFVITAVDSISVRVSDTFTVIVNRWPVIASSAIVTSGLKISLDAGNSSSYSGSGRTWTDLSGNGKNGTWQQSPTFKSASGGSLAMGSSTSQYMSSSGLGATNVLTAEVWVKFNVIPVNDNCIISDQYTASFINFSICFRNDSKIYGGYWNGTNGWVTSAGTATPL